MPQQDQVEQVRYRDKLGDLGESVCPEEIGSHVQYFVGDFVEDWEVALVVVADDCRADDKTEIILLAHDLHSLQLFKHLLVEAGFD